MRTHVGITVLVGCALMAMGCASIIERSTIRNTNLVGQSMWRYDRGPYPGVRCYASNFRRHEVSEEARRHDLAKVGGVGGAIVLGIIITPFWLADVVLTTGVDTVLLPYDLVMWEREDTDEPTAPSGTPSEAGRD